MADRLVVIDDIDGRIGCRVSSHITGWCSQVFAVGMFTMSSGKHVVGTRFFRNRAGVAQVN